MSASRGAPARDTPALIVVAGGVASGKSTVSRALAAAIGAERLEADRIRSTLLGALADETAGAEARWRRDLSPGFEGEIYDDLLRRADAVLADGGAVVLDACFPHRSQRRAAKAIAARRAARFLVVECRVPGETLRARLAERDRAAGQSGWASIHERLAEAWEPMDDLGDRIHMTVDATGDVEPIVTAIRERLAATPVAERRPGRALDPPPRVVSFDCWSTLLAEEDWPWAYALRVRALADAAREAGQSVSDETAATAFDTAWRRHMELWQQGVASGAAEVARWGLEALGLADVHPAREHLVRRFEEASHTSHVVAIAGARPLLAGLREAGISCVLVCDTGLTPGRVVRRLLDRVGLLEYLRVLAFSDEVGFPKPDARSFRAAIDPLGIAPEEAVHVGDLRRTDVAGARAIGMRTVRIRARHDDLSELPDADHVVGSHAELAALLGVDPVDDAPVAARAAGHDVPA
jgi:putative hydrolase of the HAD superfamily